MKVEDVLDLWERVLKEAERQGIPDLQKQRTCMGFSGCNPAYQQRLLRRIYDPVGQGPALRREGPTYWLYDCPIIP